MSKLIADVLNNVYRPDVQALNVYAITGSTQIGTEGELIADIYNDVYVQQNQALAVYIVNSGSTGDINVDGGSID